STADDVAKSQRWAKVDTTCGIKATHDRITVITCCVQAFDRLSFLIQHRAVFIRGDSGESTETSRMNLHRVERPLFNRRQRRVRTYLWVPSIAVEFCFTTAKFGISSLAGIRIEF